MYQLTSAFESVWLAGQEDVLAPPGLVKIVCYSHEIGEIVFDNFTNSSDDHLMSFEHHQTGSIFSAELPKNCITFKVHNADGKWDLNNPNGWGKYLTERMRVEAWYGFSFYDGIVQKLIPAGKFFLSEWSTSADGMEVQFTARDVMEFAINTPFVWEKDKVYDNLLALAFDAIDQIPNSTSFSETDKEITEDEGTDNISMDFSLKSFSAKGIVPSDNETVATILQKCANAARMVMRAKRYGWLCIEKMSNLDTGYTIPLRVSYSHPKVTLLKPLKAVEVSHGNYTYRQQYAPSGEVQTLSNNFITTSAQAAVVAEWIGSCLKSRKQIEGEYRCDPRLDVFDIVSVETKYGDIKNVVLTDIKVSFSGAFKSTYSGYVIEANTTSSLYLNEVYMGEVN